MADDTTTDAAQRPQRRRRSADDPLRSGAAGLEHPSRRARPAGGGDGQAQPEGAVRRPAMHRQVAHAPAGERGQHLDVGDVRGDQSAAVMPRPARRNPALASVRANREWVMLSTCRMLREPDSLDAGPPAMISRVIVAVMDVYLVPAGLESLRALLRAGRRSRNPACRSVRRRVEVAPGEIQRGARRGGTRTGSHRGRHCGSGGFGRASVQASRPGRPLARRADRRTAPAVELRGQTEVRAFYPVRHRRRACPGDDPAGAWTRT